MIFSPIFHIELLTVGRRRRYFFARVIYALVLLIVMVYCYLGTFSQNAAPTLSDHARFAYAFFASFSVIQMIVVLGLTPAMIAGTISVEHERKTIDYLLTTQLSDTEIALGKFAARLWSVVMQLTVGLPILAIALTLGGVGPEQMIESFGTAFVVLVFTATLCLAISSRAARSRESITRAYLVIIAMLTVPPILSGVCEPLSHLGGGYPLIAGTAQFLKEPLEFLVAIHPFVFLTAILSDSPSLSSGVDFTTFAGCYLGASVVLAVSAVVGVRRFYLKLAGRSAAVPTSFFGGLRNAFRGRRKPVGEWAMLWKEIASLRSAIDLGWTGRIAGALLYGMALFFIGMGFYWSMEADKHLPSEGTPMEITSMALVPMVFGLMLLLITSNAAGAITGERERDTWVTLMSTPLNGSEIVQAKLLAVLYGVRRWYQLILLCWALTLSFRPGLIAILPFVIFVHLIAALFAACVGMRCSLQATTSLKSMGIALAIMVLGTTIAPMMLMGFLGLASRSGKFWAMTFPSSLPVLFSSIHPSLLGWSRQPQGSGDPIAFYLVGLCFWTLVYGGATCFLYYQLVAAFDRYAGRSSQR